MFWSLVLPIQIAVALSAILTVVVYMVARHQIASRALCTMLGVVIAGMTFVPVCLLVYVIASPLRFGHFESPDTESVRLEHVRQYLPPSATNIAMITTPHHHHVRFQVAQPQLVTWMNGLWDVAGQHSPMPRSEAAFGELTSGDNDLEFHTLGMNPDAEFMKFEGPYQGDWGGPTLWYDSESETAWQYVGYW